MNLFLSKLAKNLLRSVERCLSLVAWKCIGRGELTSSFQGKLVSSFDGNGLKEA